MNSTKSRYHAPKTEIFENELLRRKKRMKAKKRTSCKSQKGKKNVSCKGITNIVTYHKENAVASAAEFLMRRKTTSLRN